VELYWEAHTFMIGKLYSTGRRINIASRKMGKSTRAHRMKTDGSFVATGQLKRMVNASRSLTLMSVTKHEVSDAKHEMIPYVSNNHEVSQGA
jgi:hypothetical protein